MSGSFQARNNLPALFAPKGTTHQDMLARQQPQNQGGIDISGLFSGLNAGGGGNLRPQQDPRANVDIQGLRNQIGGLTSTLQNPTQGQTDRQMQEEFQRSRTLADSRAQAEQARMAQRTGGNVSGPLFNVLASQQAGSAAAGVGADASRIRRDEALNRQRAEETRRSNLMNVAGLQAGLANLDERGRQFDASFNEGGRQFDADFSLRNDPGMRRLQMIQGLFGALGSLGNLAGGVSF